MSLIKFVPTLYEHCAALIGKTPSEVAKSEDLLVQGQLKAYELYQHDLISVGLDIYNIEAEALGGAISYHSDTSLPSLNGAVIKSKEDFLRLKLPNPETDGRMPMLLNACGRIKREVAVPVSGAIVGPFTLAAILRGFEDFMVDIIEDPEFAKAQIQFAKNVGITFAKAFHKRGVDVAVNESWIAPPLCSPSIYNEFAKPAEKGLIDELKRIGIKSVALISGGNTTQIISDMLDTGTTLVMADWGCDRAYYKTLCQKRNVTLRASIESSVVQRGDTIEMAACARAVVDDCGDYDNFVFGCGIVSNDTKSENVLRLKGIIRILEK